MCSRSRGSARDCYMCIYTLLLPFPSSGTGPRNSNCTSFCPLFYRCCFVCPFPAIVDCFSRLKCYLGVGHVTIHVTFLNILTLLYGYCRNKGTSTWSGLTRLGNQVNRSPIKVLMHLQPLRIYTYLQHHKNKSILLIGHPPVIPIVIKRGKTTPKVIGVYHVP